MEIKDLDIVYTIKEPAIGNELKYSLRSLKNFAHRDIYIYGGCPDYVDKSKVRYIEAEQNKGNKWLNTSKLLEMIVQNDNISEDFVWFNDDFYVLKETETLPYYYDRTLDARVGDFAKVWQGFRNNYCIRLSRASRALKWKNRNNKNFELHIPMVFNRKKLAEVMRLFESEGAKRSLYGNCVVSDAIERDDVKIYDLVNVPDKDWDFLSTSDRSFREGAVGEWIKKKFNRKSEYEK